MALFIFLCTRGNLVIAFLWCLEMAYRLAVLCNVIKFMMLLWITIPWYAPSHEKFGATPRPPSLLPRTPPPSPPQWMNIRARQVTSTSGLQEARVHKPLDCTKPLWKYNRTFLNSIQTYAATDLFWQPITCFSSFAFSLFHVSFLFFSITSESLGSCGEDITIVELDHCDETNDVMHELVL